MTIPIGVRYKHDEKDWSSIAGTQNGQNAVLNTNLWGGKRCRIYQASPVLLAGGVGRDDRYSLSTLECAELRAGKQRWQFTNYGNWDLTGCWPLKTISYPPTWLMYGGSGNPWAWNVCGQFDEALVSRAVLSAYAKLDKTVVQSSVTAAESPQTLKMLRLVKLAKLIKSPAQTCVKAFTSLAKDVKKAQRGRTKGIWETGKVASNYWLEYRMGLQPALYEFDAYRTLLLKGVARTDSAIHRVTAVAKGPERFFETSVAYDMPYITLFYLKFNHWAQDKAGCTIFYRDKNLSDAEKWRQALGLNFESVPEHIWETVPLSFVVDRFVDVSTWIKAWKPKPGIDILAAIASRKRHMVVDKYTRTYIAGSNIKPPVDVSPFYYEQRNLSRILAPSRSSLPLLNTNVLKLKQHLDHLSLTIQRIPSMLASIKRK